MVVCSCRSVSHHTVCEAIASGAATVEELSDQCSVAADCGGCWRTLERLLDEHRPDPVRSVSAAA